MVVTLKQSGDSFTFKLSPQAAQELALKDGSVITIARTPEAKTPTFRYATTEEAMAAYEATRPEYDEVYRELAK